MTTELDNYDKTIYTNELKGYQLRLVLSEFREKYYIHIRKYFLSYEGEYVASKEGISMEASFDNVISLIDGLANLCSDAELKQILESHICQKSQTS